MTEKSKRNEQSANTGLDWVVWFEGDVEVDDELYWDEAVEKLREEYARKTYKPDCKLQFMSNMSNGMWLWLEGTFSKEGKIITWDCVKVYISFDEEKEMWPWRMLEWKDEVMVNSTGEDKTLRM